MLPFFTAGCVGCGPIQTNFKYAKAAMMVVLKMIN